MSDLLWACGDVRDVCSLSSLFLLHVHPHGMVVPCPAPAISSHPVPQDPASPAKPPSVSASTEEDAVERTRVMQRRRFPASPAHARAVQEQGQCSAAGQHGSGCPVEELAQGRQQLEGSVVRLNARSRRRLLTSVLKATHAPAKQRNKD